LDTASAACIPFGGWLISIRMLKSYLTFYRMSTCASSPDDARGVASGPWALCRRALESLPTSCTAATRAPNYAAAEPAQPSTEETFLNAQWMRVTVGTMLSTVPAESPTVTLCGMRPGWIRPHSQQRSSANSALAGLARQGS